jgi:hypothetical protein
VSGGAGDSHLLERARAFPRAYKRIEKALGLPTEAHRIIGDSNLSEGRPLGFLPSIIAASRVQREFNPISAPATKIGHETVM